MRLRRGTRTAALLLAAWVVTAWAGCRAPSEPGAGAARDLAARDRAATLPESQLAVITLDGRRARIDRGGLHCVIAEPVSVNPLVTFAIDASLGRFESAVITVREVHRGVVALDGLFVSDVVADELAKLRPGRPFHLLTPGLDVVVGSASGMDTARLRPGQAYQLDLVVQGARGYAAVSTRFRTGDEPAGWPSR